MKTSRKTQDHRQHLKPLTKQVSDGSAEPVRFYPASNLAWPPGQSFSCASTHAASGGGKINGFQVGQIKRESSLLDISAVC